MPVWIAPNGNDSNSGSSGSPVKTMAAALATGQKTVIFKDGDYLCSDVRCNLASVSGTLELIADSQAQVNVKFTGSNGAYIATDFLPHANRTNVYYAPIDTSKAPNVEQSFMWCINVPWSPISDSDRRPAHRGRSHRSPYFPLYPAASLDDLEAATRPSWRYMDGVMYVNGVPGSSSHKLKILVSRNTSAAWAVYNGHPGVEVKISGIQYHYCSLNLDYVRWYELDAVNVYAPPLNGFSLSRAQGVDRYCTVVGASNDCWNAYGLSSTTSAAPGLSTIAAVNTSIEPYAAVTLGDCRSIHSACVGSVHGGLYEYGGLSGASVAAGAEESYYYTEMAYCQQNIERGNRGTLAIVVDPSDDGHKTVLNAKGVVIREAPRGFAVIDGPGIMNLEGCRTENVDNLFVAVTDGVINATDHRNIGGGTLTYGSGTFNIVNSSPITP